MRNIHYINKSIIILFLLPFIFTGCKKYLNTKPDKSLVVPSKLKELQAVLDNSGVMNWYTSAIGEASADNYYVDLSTWSGLDDGSKNVYTWGDELFYGNTSTINNGWYSSYRSVYYANFILENLKKIPKTEANGKEWNNLKGSALFFRSWYFHDLVTAFSRAYDSTSASLDLGIPLILTTNFNKPYKRSTVEQSYAQIIEDLAIACSLLPDVAIFPSRPSKAASYGLLSRVYLSMGDYKKANFYADSCLDIYDKLMDYNGGPGINEVGSNFPFTTFNPETIFFATGAHSLLSTNNAKVDSNLYHSYSSNDLRLKLFFDQNDDGSHAFVGNYDENGVPFVGIATDEIYLTKAECLAREGKTSEAMNILNDLLAKRWKAGEFTPFTVNNSKDALDLILRERRKELLMRDIRWMDIKRLNKEGANIILKRVLNGDVYQLKPNDNRYALPLPNDIIKMSDLSQNPR